jgi:GT2 family glycosyltransferase
MSQMDDIGCLTGKLLGYDPETEQANGFFDSTGIFRKWYGRWYDRGLGKVDTGQYNHSQFLPAACGAFMVCRKKAIDKILVNNQDVFDPDFFLYKEDIEFSLRLRKNGYKIFYDPEVAVYHCRGWNQKRSQVSYRNRLMSAENELLLYRKHVSLYYIWALFKYLLVRVFRV